jgi:hypothetical protein
VQIRQATFRQVEELLQIEHRQNAAAHIDDAQHESGSARQRSQVPQRMYVLNMAGFQRITLRSQLEFQQLQHCAGGH